MKKLIRNILILLLVGVIGITVAFVLIYGPNFGIYLRKPSPQEYVQQAVKFMDNQGIYSDTDEWRVVRNETIDKASTMSSYEDTYELLDEALKTVGGKHSKLITPNNGGNNTVSIQMPTVEIPMDGIVMIRLPEFSGDSKANEEYANIIHNAIKKIAPKMLGAIIDLRGNTGGDMGPMVAAVSSLLDDGTLMNFGIKGILHPVTLEDGCVSGGGSTVAVNDPIKVKGIPVAILQDDMTASSGEATLLCFRGLDYVKTFGIPTAGYCSCNNVIKLYDGATMLLTIGSDIARTKEAFCEDPIEPDVYTDDPVNAAVEWIQGH